MRDTSAGLNVWGGVVSTVCMVRVKVNRASLVLDLVLATVISA